MNQKTLSIKLSKNEAQQIFNKLISEGFKIENPNNEYILWRVSGNGIVAMYYTSGKLVAQGVGDFSTLQPEKNINSEFIDIFQPHIGSDEVGKGDYFGPLVVCSAYIDKNSYTIVKALGIADSKTLSDSKILKIYKEIKNKIKFEVTIANPTEYNKEIKRIGNVAIYLANLHKETIIKLLEGVEDKRIEVVVDQFSSSKGRLNDIFMDTKINLTQFHKGESDIAVATASVIARAVFLEEMLSMDNNYGLEFPKGASNVIEFAKEFVKKFGKDELSNVAKISFKTTNSIL